MSQLERFFTPRSAKAVEKALGAMGQQLAQEEQAQGHRVPPGLAALQRGACQSVDAEANVRMRMWEVSFRSHHTACIMPMITVGTLVPATVQQPESACPAAMHE